MKNLLGKSKEHLLAADTLYDAGYYSSIPHCTYYACFQLMICIENMEICYEGSGSHKRLIAAIENEIKKKNGRTSAFEFNKNITKLKTDRILADYKKKIYYLKEANKNIELAKRVVDDLAMMFQITYT